MEGRLAQLKGGNAQLDDQAGRAVDAATEEISAANGAIRSKQDQLRRNETRQAQIQSQVGLGMGASVSRGVSKNSDAGDGRSVFSTYVAHASRLAGTAM